MKKEYTLILTTTEEKPYNKFNHLIMERIDNELQCLDIVKEEFPKVTVRQTKKELDWFVNYLQENGYVLNKEFIDGSILINPYIEYINGNLFK